MSTQTQQSVESFPTTLGGAAAAVSNMSREVASSFGPLMAALYNAYSQFNKLDLSLAFQGAMTSLGGAVVSGLAQVGGAVVDTLSAKDYYGANKERSTLHNEFYGNYDQNETDPTKQNTGKITFVDNELATNNGSSVSVGANAQSIVPSKLDKDSLNNLKSKFEAEYSSKSEDIKSKQEAQNKSRTGQAALFNVAGQVAKSASDGAASIYQANSKVVSSVASQFMSVLGSMFGTVSEILRNNPNTAFTGFAR